METWVEPFQPEKMKVVEVKTGDYFIIAKEVDSREISGQDVYEAIDCSYITTSGQPLDTRLVLNVSQDKLFYLQGSHLVYRVYLQYPRGESIVFSLEP